MFEMTFLQNVFVDPKATKIDDFFKTQRFYLLFIGVWPPITTTNVYARRILKVARCLLQIFNVLAMLHLSVLFGWTFYLEIGSGSFASLSFALSELTIFGFGTFTVIYMILKANTITSMIYQMNTSFRFRSAKGKL